MLISSLFFTLLNFGIFLGLCVYFYRTYGKKLLFDQMQAQEEATRLLEMKAIALQEEETRLKSQAVQDALLILNLQEKVARWRTASDQELVKEHKEQDLIQEKLKKKAHLQNAWYAKHTLAQQVLPEILEKTYSQLITVFKEERKKQEYTQQITQFLKKDSH